MTYNRYKFDRRRIRAGSDLRHDVQQIYIYIYIYIYRKFTANSSMWGSLRLAPINKTVILMGRIYAKCKSRYLVIICNWLWTSLQLSHLLQQVSPYNNFVTFINPPLYTGIDKTVLLLGGIVWSIMNVITTCNYRLQEVLYLM